MQPVPILGHADLFALARRLWTCLLGLSLITLGLVLVAAPAGATDKCGAVCNETWTLAGSPYVVTCDVTV